MGGTGAALYRGGMSNIFNPAFLAVETVQPVGRGLFPGSGARGPVPAPVRQLRQLGDRRGHRQQPAPLLADGLRLGRPRSTRPACRCRSGCPWPTAIPIPTPSRRNCAIPILLPAPIHPRDSILEDRTRKVTGTLRDALPGRGGRRGRLAVLRARRSTTPSAPGPRLRSSGDSTTTPIIPRWTGVNGKCAVRHERRQFHPGSAGQDHRAGRGRPGLGKPA